MALNNNEVYKALQVVLSFFIAYKVLERTIDSAYETFSISIAAESHMAPSAFVRKIDPLQCHTPLHTHILGQRTCTLVPQSVFAMPLSQGIGRLHEVRC